MQKNWTYVTWIQTGFLVNIKTEVIYSGIEKNVENRFDTSGYRLDIPLSKVKNKKVIGFMIDKLIGKVMTEFLLHSYQ